MESLSPQVVSAAKLPILNSNEFDLRKIGIEQYFLMTVYSLWEVILNGDSPIPTRVINDAKSLMEYIEKRFGGNTETKKVQKTLIMQQYENFTGSSSECLDQIHDRLPIEWRTHTLIWRNKTDLEDQSLDDLFNSLKIYEAESNSPQLDNDDLKQIDADDLEEMDLKCVMVLEAMIRAFRQMKNPQTMPSWHSSPQVLIIRKSQFDVLSYKTGLDSVEARIVVYQQNENVFEKDIKLLKLNVMLRDNALVELRKKFKTAEQERDELKLKLENFQTSLKNLSKLLASQITYKTRLDFDNQVLNSTVFDCDELISSCWV
uniref:Ribonuclease H-like domain-containing protein n=1 Tax=Tanacetum cinerariifolium TaxID=118510 RepID=A0A6L2KDF1_TANCI|nr:ribonuclease H-like domain-containing protein [Tanacetum cinerariifolium]